MDTGCTQAGTGSVSNSVLVASLEELIAEGARRCALVRSDCGARRGVRGVVEDFYQPTRVLLNKTPTRLREHNCLAKDGPLHSYGGCDGVVVSFLYSGVICVGVSVVYSRGVHRLFATCIYSLCGALTTRDGVRRLLPHVFIRSFTRYTWSNTCRLSPRVLTLSAERCPSWVRRFVCPCLCLLALLGGVRLCVRLCQRIVYVLEHV